MTDPRAALAEALEAAGMYEKDDPTEYPGSPIHAEDAADIQTYLAESGVLLVTEERLRLEMRRLMRAGHLMMHADDADKWSAAIFAALSADD